MDTSITRTVLPEQAGVRLDVFLAEWPEIGSRTVARRLLDAGAVRVGGKRTRPGLFLEPGLEVACTLAPALLVDPLAPDLPLPDVPVLYDDPWLCVIDKPAGLAAHPPEDKTIVAHTVASWARARFGDLPCPPDADRPGIVHRLDRDTTGVMVVAKTEPAMAALRLQWKERQVHKEYRAIVYGEPRFQSDWIERQIATDPKHKDRMAVVESGGREASTYYEVVERLDGFAHVVCKPKTGRTHQIRVHMTSIGHSLLGDRVYRSRLRQHDALPAGAPPVRRQCLHAHRLQFEHPGTQEPMAFEAPLPADMVALLQWLRGRARQGP
ncbi:MAG: RluA family pseudouridine synthase [Planctomycetes bacterium]|nr:RluA family pseudouridine synthase [Planctomycetota bacterium]